MVTTKDTAFVCMVLILGAQFQTEPVIKPSLSSGVMLQDTPRFLLMERKILSQKIFVCLDPRISIERNKNISHFECEIFQNMQGNPFIILPISKHAQLQRFISFLFFFDCQHCLHYARDGGFHHHFSSQFYFHKDFASGSRNFKILIWKNSRQTIPFLYQGGQKEKHPSI